MNYLSFKAFKKLELFLNQLSSYEEEIIDKHISLQRMVIYNNYVLPFLLEVETNLLHSPTTTGKRDILRHYIFELLPIAENLIKNYHSFFEAGHIDHDKPDPGNHKYEYLAYDENAAILVRKTISHIVGGFEYTAIKYKLNLIEDCNDLCFDLEFFGSVNLRYFEIKRLEFAERKKNLKSSDSSEVKHAQIQFSSEKNLLNVYNLIKGLFPDYEAMLLKKLQGEETFRKLCFRNNQNKFVELFSRIKYNGLIISTPIDLTNWICENFEYLKVKGKHKEQTTFKANTVSDIITKGKGEPTKKERILVSSWLEYVPFHLR